MRILKFTDIVKKRLRAANARNTPEKINPVLLKKDFSSSPVGHEIIYFENIDSTNKEARKLADKGISEGVLLIAEEQTKGRGRLNRSWASAPFENLLMSIIFRPALPPSKIFLLTMIASVAIVKAVKKTTGLKAGIKWPNDIYFNNKKLAGILTELKADRTAVNYAIVGIGLNVNFDPAEYSDLKETATSLYRETGKIVSRNILLRTILYEINKEYTLLKNGKISRIQKEWNRHSIVTGKAVKVFSGEYSEEGIAESIAEDGSLTLIKIGGERKKILCGDVSLRLK